MAKDLRKNITDAEKVLWFHLRQNPEAFKFRRQHPLGIYIADFYSHKAKLIFEVDGNMHNSSDAIANDDIRQKKLKKVE